MHRLREALTSANFTVDGVQTAMGQTAHQALLRNEVVPALRVTNDGSPLATLIRLFSLQQAVLRSHADRALAELVDALHAADILEVSGDEVRALIDVRPYGDEKSDWWVLCDLTPGLTTQAPTRSDFVLGISEASSSLAQLMVRPEVERALDLGTGCGVQSLHLAQHARTVVATDVNPRALHLARLTAELNGLEFDVREGSLYEPVAGERFDLIATNPPFVVSPPSAERLVYRETNFPGDEVVRRVIAGASQHLNDGGWCQILASWIHQSGESWEDRLASWIDPTGLDAWVVQRDVADLPTYAEMWLTDAGLRHTDQFQQRYDDWLTWADAQGYEAMGFGWLSLRKAERDQPVVRIEEFPYELAQPVGPTVADWGRRMDALENVDPLDICWTLVEDVVQETFGPVGSEDPEVVIARLQRGLRRARQLDTIEAGMLSACDGDLTPRQILGALASLLDRDAAELHDKYVDSVVEFVTDGFLG